MKQLFDNVSIRCSKITTHMYSTSFSIGIQCLGQSLRDPIYAIYGFVRFADEIVDTFHDYDKETLLMKFRSDTYDAIESGISLNPILNSFQHTVKKYGIERELIDSFLHSMELDLTETQYDSNGIDTYILGSAEVVGLMCLRVFCNGNDAQYKKLKPHAMSLGAAFQKINFLRDLKADYEGLGRTYFPDINLTAFDESRKRAIEQSIQKDFDHGFEGIRQLPRSSRFGVYVAYMYYLSLFKKIRDTPSQEVMRSRIRIRNRHKASLLAYSYLKHQLNLL